MSVYRGVIRGNVVLLPDGVELADGAAVEVRVIANAALVGDAETEWLFKQRLLESGLIKEARTESRDEPIGDRTPVKVTGRPLSEDVIEERR